MENALEHLIKQTKYNQITFAKEVGVSTRTIQNHCKLDFKDVNNLPILLVYLIKLNIKKFEFENIKINWKI